MISIDPGSVAIGATVSLIGWGIFIFVIFFPQIRRLKQYFEDKYETEKQNVIKTIKDELENILSGKDKKFNAILDAKLPEITNKFKEEFKTAFDEELPKVMNSVADYMIETLGDPENEKVRELIANLGWGAFMTLKESILEDPEVKRWAQGKINGYVNGIVSQMEGRFGFSEEDMKAFKEMIKTYQEKKHLIDQYGGGVDPNNPMSFLFNMMSPAPK